MAYTEIVMYVRKRTLVLFRMYVHVHHLKKTLQARSTGVFILFSFLSSGICITHRFCQSDIFNSHLTVKYSDSKKYI